MKINKRNKTRKYFSCFVIITLLLMNSLVPAFAVVTPPSLEATLAPGESVTETKTVQIPTRPPKADVCLPLT
ncbi:MAG: hypothetical protein ACOY30_07415 [Bacillota bacterium]